MKVATGRDGSATLRFALLLTAASAALLLAVEVVRGSSIRAPPMES